MLQQDEKELVKQKYYSEAIRYMDNAKETLQKAGKEDYFYTDRKYVRTACGTAYNGVLIALDTYLLLKSGLKKTKGRKSIEYYQEQVGKIDKKLLWHVNSAYEALHLFGYYDGTLNARIVQAGFDEAYEIINQIKPIESN
ncbi:hypothetical protein EZS27_016564 [termite gut metagenome]|uniref:DUF5618 domain-containing protein n=1 Tax=termite gut metagenome TaxID=433724 RepID=A0A5J4RNB9_9ZZZZ